MSTASQDLTVYPARTTTFKPHRCARSLVPRLSRIDSSFNPPLFLGFPAWTARFLHPHFLAFPLGLAANFCIPLHPDDLHFISCSLCNDFHALFHTQVHYVR